MFTMSDMQSSTHCLLRCVGAATWQFVRCSNLYAAWLQPSRWQCIHPTHRYALGVYKLPAVYSKCTILLRSSDFSNQQFQVSSVNVFPLPEPLNRVCPVQPPPPPPTPPPPRPKKGFNISIHETSEDSTLVRTDMKIEHALYTA